MNNDKMNFRKASRWMKRLEKEGYCAYDGGISGYEQTKNNGRKVTVWVVSIYDHNTHKTKRFWTQDDLVEFTNNKYKAYA